MPQTHTLKLILLFADLQGAKILMPEERSGQSPEDAIQKENLPALNGFQAEIVKEVQEVRVAVEQIGKIRNIHSRQLMYAALVFFGASIFLFVSFALLVLKTNSIVTINGFQSLQNAEIPFRESLAMYLMIYSPPLSIAISAVVCISIGYMLLGQAGALVRTVIPREDQDFLKSLNKQDQESIEQYIRLTSLTGITGFFTKIGITGLPLATIALTIVFGALALLFDGAEGTSRFFDFANLTLGAFLGSYVQKHASDTMAKVDK